nr:hypothetical protein [uncultured Flavobacterium sp.]
MKNTLVMFLIFCSLIAKAQVDDVITKHNGEIVKGKVVKIEDFNIVFKYSGEEAENSVSKYAIEKIVYGSTGRVEEISGKIVVNSDKDWQKVIILEEKRYISGLKRGGDVRGKTGLINIHTGNTGDQKAEKKLRMSAAALGCPFVLVISDKTTIGSDSNEIGGTQVIKTGIGYKY